MAEKQREAEAKQGERASMAAGTGSKLTELV